ncbi:unnamed protein product [Aphis gossypii]|uniref:Uncharacterized protein n=1 Tax=Aphis gossypii TaxID=80765 RepID=A0A9P0ILJ0_APHGO|nr:unnamed protein product [Aphis gossypii]
MEGAHALMRGDDLGQARQSHRRPDQRCRCPQRKLSFSLVKATLTGPSPVSGGT